MYIHLHTYIYIYTYTYTHTHATHNHRTCSSRLNSAFSRVKDSMRVMRSAGVHVCATGLGRRGWRKHL